MHARPFLFGATAALLMLAVYFTILTLVSGWAFTIDEFSQYWPYVVALVVGFGTQIGLYIHLKHRIARHHGTGRVVAATGTTSTLAMISCCTHYIANLLPVIGAAGLVTLAAQYQIELFWVGIAFNLAGIAFVANRILQERRHHA